MTVSLQEPDLEKGSECVVLEDGSKFQINTTGFTSTESAVLLQQWGKNELEEKKTPSWLVFVKQLYFPMPIMIWAAIAFEIAIQDWLDVAVLLFLQLGNATLSWYEETKSGDAVAALRKSLKPKATVKRDGRWQNTDASQIVPGDLVLLASGAAVPADCVVNSGTIDVDQAALTGESLPVTMAIGSSVKMGSTVCRGEVEATVQSTGKHTFLGKTAAMLQSVDDLGHLQKILLAIMMALAVFSVVLCTLSLVYLLVVQSVSLLEAIQFTVIVLVASIPIAMEVVTTSTLALGSRQLTNKEAIVSRLAAIEDVAGMTMLCSDKTGTLTLNKMVIQQHTPVFQPDLDQYTLLRYASMAAKWKEPPKDALDTLVLTSVDLDSLSNVELLDHMPFDPSVKRTESTVREDGIEFKVSKGAPNIILKLLSGVHLATVQDKLNREVEDLARRGIRALAIAKSNQTTGEWELLGLLTFLDPPRPDTKDTIHRAMAYGVQVKMITGDHRAIAQETARQLGMGDNILTADGLPAFNPQEKIPQDLGEKYGKLITEADGFAGVYPEHKYLIVEALRQCGYSTGMTGDGVNDAPALKRADVGIAVEGSTDAARAASDIILTAPGLSVIVDAIVISRCIFRRMKSFLIYRIASTLEIVCFFFFAVLFMHPSDFNPYWPVYFSLPVGMLILITVLNDGTIITIAYDNVQPSQHPEKWRMGQLFAVAIALGAVACGSSLLLLYLALGTALDGSVLTAIGLPMLSYGEIVTLLYLKISVSDFLTIFCARSTGWLWSSRPHWMLATGAVFATVISVLLAAFWPESTDPEVQGLALGGAPIWIPVSLGYSLFFWVVQDAVKVLMYWILETTDSARALPAIVTSTGPNRKLIRWMAAGVLFAITFAMYASVTIINPVISTAMADAGLSSISAAIVLSVYPFSMMLSMPLVSTAIHKFGRLSMALLGTVILAVATVPLGSAYYIGDQQSDAVITVYILMRIVAGFGGSLAEVAAYSMAMDMFAADVGKVSGVNEVIVGGAFLIGPSLGVLLVGAYGTPMAFVVWGLSISVPVPFLVYLIMNHRWFLKFSDVAAAPREDSPLKTQDVETGVGDEKTVGKPRGEIDVSVAALWARVVNTRTALAYTLNMISTMGSIILLAFMPGHLRDYGFLTEFQIGLTVSLVAVFFTVSGFPMGWLIDTDRWNPHLLNNIGMVAAGVCLAVVGLPLARLFGPGPHPHAHTGPTYDYGDYMKDVAALVSYGCCMAAIFVPILVVLKRSSPNRDARATEATVALYTFTESIAMGIAPLIGTPLVNYLTFYGTMMVLGFAHLVIGTVSLIYDIWYPPPGKGGGGPSKELANKQKETAEAHVDTIKSV